jgi:hypothetical protein
MVVRILLSCIPALLLFCSIRLLRQFGGIGPVILLVGSGAILIVAIVDLVLELLMPYVLSHHRTPFVQSFWGACMPNAWVRDTEDVLRLLGFACLFIGFVWFSLRATRHI